MEHLADEIHKLTDLLQAALSYGEMGEVKKVISTLRDAIKLLRKIIHRLAAHGIVAKLPDKS